MLGLVLPEEKKDSMSPSEIYTLDEPSHQSQCVIQGDIAKFIVVSYQHDSILLLFWDEVAFGCPSHSPIIFHTNMTTPALLKHHEEA